MLIFISYTYYLLLLLVVLLGLLSPLGLFFFGGAKRNALAFFSTGLFALLTASVFLATFNASYLAKMDNAYLLNLSLGFWFVLVASFLMISCLAGYGVNRWLALALGLVGAAGGYYSNSLASGLDSPYGGTPNMLFAAGLAVLSFVLLLIFGRWRDLLKGLLLGGGSAVVFLVIFGFLRPYIALLSVNYDTNISGEMSKPPVLGGGLWGTLAAFLYPLLAVAIFLVARAWSRPVEGEASPPVLDAPIVPQP